MTSIRGLLTVRLLSYSYKLLVDTNASQATHFVCI